MKKIGLFILLIFAASPVLTFGQAGSYADLKSRFKDAEYDYSQEDYYLALSKYAYVYRFDSLNANVNYCMGVCYLKTAFDKPKAKSYLERAVKSVTKDYKDGTYDEKNAKQEAFLYLGQAYRLNNEIDKAVEAFNSYKKLIPAEDKKNQAVVDRELLQCTHAKKVFQGKPQVSVARNNVSDINSAFSDHNAVFNQDETAVVFINQQLEGKSNDDMKLMYSKKVDGKWLEPVEISEKIKTRGNMWPTWISPDGKHILLAEDDDSKTAIHESTLKFTPEDTSWTPAKKLNSNINKGKVTHASISPDGKYLYFTSERKEGFGGLDIYKSEKNASGDWGPAVNLGNKVNGPFNEETPFLLDDKTLYFSSEGHSSIGGYDIFYSKLDGKNEWSTPVNPGYMLNTTDDNLFYEPVIDGNSGFIYLTGDDATGERDIYKVNIFPYKEDVAQNNNNDAVSTDQQVVKKDETKDIKKDETDGKTKQDQAKNETNKNQSDKNNQKQASSDFKFIIQVAASTKEENPYAFVSLKGVKQNKSKRGLYIYTYGEYKTYISAFNDLHNAQDKGFKDAFIIGYEKFKESNFEGGKESGNIKTIAELINEQGPLCYAVQFATLFRLVDNSVFKNITEIKTKSTGNRTEYYTGNFEKYSTAKNEQEKIRSLGYQDAFIIKCPK